MKVVLTLVVSIVISFGVCCLYVKSTEKKVAYVRNGVVLSQYVGMQTMTDIFESEMKVVRSNADTLKARYERLFSQQPASNAGKEKEEWSYRLGIARSEYEGYAQRSGEQMQRRRQELTASVLTDINEFVQAYGEEQGYHLILGATNDGSVLYGNSEDDITDQIIQELNDSYSANTDN